MEGQIFIRIGALSHTLSSALLKGLPNSYVETIHSNTLPRARVTRVNVTQ